MSFLFTHPSNYSSIGQLFLKKIVKFPGRQIACIFNKKISFTMLSVRGFLILPSPFKTSRIAVQRPSINLSRRWFNDHHICRDIALHGHATGPINIFIFRRLRRQRIHTWRQSSSHNKQPF